MPANTSEKYETFTLDVTDAIAHLRFCRPDKANSMTPAFWRELPAAIKDISDKGEARVIVLSAEGKHFSSGMDISVFMENGALFADDSPREVVAERFRHSVKELQDTFSALENARQPVLAAIQGGAVGAGVDLVTACDCRYATRDAFFSVHETAIGMTADVGTFPRLAKLIPEGIARQMSYTAERLPADRAKAAGLVNEVYDDADEMLAAVMETARQIAQHSPLAVTGVKRMITYSRDHTTDDTLDYVAVWNAGMLSIRDIQETYTAKAEKRSPDYPALQSLKHKGA
ncbi:MAG: crotonase/enoyl-CoA hydratase family protein [Pseudomonadota bacterium]